MPIIQYERKTSDIIISDQLRDILEIFKDRSEVARLLLFKRLSKEVLQDNHINYIGVSKNDPTKIAYLTQDRIEQIAQSPDADFWSTSKRIACKPGSFIGKILKDIPAKEVENFATLYKTFSEVKDVKFKVVSGKNIKKYYDESTYFSQKGTLGNSCMKYDACQQYFDIYIENTASSMLLMLSPDDLLIGRALLWTVGDVKVMDRIYTISDDEYLNYMTKWAVDNGYIHRVYQNWASSLHFTDGKVEFERQLDIQLDKWDFRHYPYLDTFKWLDMNTGILSNYRPEHFKDDSDNTLRTLTVACGTYEHASHLKLDDIDRDYAYCGDLVQIKDGIFTSASNCRYSETIHGWVLKADSKWSEELEDYIYKDLESNNKELIKKRLDYIRKARGKKVAAETSIMDWFTKFITTQTTEWTR